jgi:hypothetical protein
MVSLLAVDRISTKYCMGTLTRTNSATLSGSKIQFRLHRQHIVYAVAALVVTNGSSGKLVSSFDHDGTQHLLNLPGRLAPRHGIVVRSQDSTARDKRWILDILYSRNHSIGLSRTRLLPGILHVFDHCIKSCASSTSNLVIET